MKKKLLTIVLSVFMTFVVSSLMTKETVFADDDVWATGNYVHLNSKNGAYSQVQSENIRWTLYNPIDNVSVLLIEGTGDEPSTITDFEYEAIHYEVDYYKSIFSGHDQAGARNATTNGFYMALKDKGYFDAWENRLHLDIRFENIKHVGNHLFNRIGSVLIDSISFDDKIETIGITAFANNTIDKVTFDGLLVFSEQNVYWSPFSGTFIKTLDLGDEWKNNVSTDYYNRNDKTFLGGTFGVAINTHASGMIGTYGDEIQNKSKLNINIPTDLNSWCKVVDVSQSGKWFFIPAGSDTVYERENVNDHPSFNFVKPYENYKELVNGENEITITKPRQDLEAGEYYTYVTLSFPYTWGDVDPIKYKVSLHINRAELGLRLNGNPISFEKKYDGTTNIPADFAIPQGATLDVIPADSDEGDVILNSSLPANAHLESANAGTRKIIFPEGTNLLTGPRANNYDFELTYTVKPVVLAGGEWSGDTFEYSGQVQKPTFNSANVTGFVNNEVLSSDGNEYAKYQVSLVGEDDGISVAPHKVQVSLVQGSAIGEKTYDDYISEGKKPVNPINYTFDYTSTGNGTKEYTINKKQPTIALTPKSSLVYNGNGQTVLDCSGDGGTVYVRVKKASDPDTFVKLENFTITDAGEYTIEYYIEGNDNYQALGSATEGFKELQSKVTINKLSLANATVTLGEELYYTGEKQTQTVSIVEVGDIDVPDTDYTITNNEQTNKGTYTLTITANTDSKNFTGSVTKEFKINKALITPTVSIENGGWTYGDQAKTPTVSGNTGSGAVTYLYKIKGAEDTTYTSEVPNAAGDYEVKATIAETDGYMGGSATCEFTIAKKEIAKPDADATAFTYTGSPQTYNVTSTGDYTVSDNTTQTNAGEYKVTIVLKDKDNTKWKDGNSDDLEYDFVISPLTITENPFTVSGTYTYNKTAQTPTLTGGSYTLDTDYEIVFDNSTNHTNAATDIPFKVKFKGNYSGEFDMKFNIDKCPITITPTESQKKTYGETDQVLTYTITSGSLCSGDSLTGALSRETGEAVGTYNITIGTLANDNYAITLSSATFTIEAKQLTNDNLEITGTYVYTGDEINPTFTVKDGDTTLIKDTDYTVAFTNNKAANDATVPATAPTVTITLKGNYSGTLTKTFVISKQDVEKPQEDSTSFVYTGSEQTYVVTENSLYTVTGNKKTDVGSYNVTIALVDKNNYQWKDSDSNDLTYSFTIAKCETNTITGLTINNWYVGETADEPSSSSTFGTISYTYAKKDSTKTKENLTYSAIVPTTAGEYWLKASVIGTDNYNGVDKYISFIIFSYPFEHEDGDISTGVLNTNENIQEAKLEPISEDNARLILQGDDFADLLQALEDGKDVVMLIEVEKPKEEDKTKFVSKGITEDNAVILDINLYAEIEGNAESKKQIKDANGYKTKVSITLTPDQATNIGVAGNKNYFILRDHEGTIEEIQAQMTIDDSGNYVFSFETDKFSTYAIYSKNKPVYVIPNTGVDSEQSNNHSLLKLSSLSLLTIGTYMVLKKKKKDN